ncbi:MAG TPA: class I SAM-dependent methyltransferase [Pyrinomonadaceae bacterium]|nr:class I SAM-dependent methyltransferase [Pyrinomonadaceae bacterium]
MRTKNAYSEIETANRYDVARKLPSKTQTQWFEALRDSLPQHAIAKVLDLGCGTGRFTTGLSKTFECPVIGVEPSNAMLSVAKAQVAPNVEWKLGGAEEIPLPDQAVDLVFMSQVFHHLTKPREALREINRVLTPAGYLAIRNGTREHNKDLAWLSFFPGAREIEDERTPSQEGLKESVCAESFELISHQTIHQLFASSNDEYFEKISQRGLSVLIMIADEAFQSGLQRFQNWVKEQPGSQPVYEPVDLFVFQKK